MKKRILILNWRCPKNPLSGGAEKVTLEHAKAWVRAGYDITWLAGNYKDGKKEEIIEGVKVVRWGTPITVYFLAPFFYWLKQGHFDLVIDEIHGIPFLSPLWAWKSKKLAYIHEVAQEIWDEMLPFPVNVLGKMYEKIYFLFYKNTPFLTGSNSTREDLVRYGVPERNITVLPHGLFLKPVDTVPEKEKDLTLIFVGRLVKMKGIEDAIRIFADVKKKNNNARFWIVGDGNKQYVESIHQLINTLQLSDSITFFGYVSEEKKRELLQKAHFLIHTSVREGFGLTVIEANSQGTPVIACNSPGLKNIVINETNGFLFDKKDIRHTISHMDSMSKDIQKYLTLARSSVKESKKYDWSIILTKSTKIINAYFV